MIAHCSFCGNKTHFDKNCIGDREKKKMCSACYEKQKPRGANKETNYKEKESYVQRKPFDSAPNIPQHDNTNQAQIEEIYTSKW